MGNQVTLMGKEKKKMLIGREAKLNELAVCREEKKLGTFIKLLQQSTGAAVTILLEEAKSIKRPATNKTVHC